MDEEPVQPRLRWRRRIGLTAAGVAVVVGVAVWPGPALWQHTTVTSARLLLRPAELVTGPGEPTALGTPADGALAATAFVGWDEPLRLSDDCVTRASVTLPAGWVRQGLFAIPGQVEVVQQDRSRVVVEQAAGVQRFLRPTFVRAGRSVGDAADLRATARVERVCDGATSTAVDVDLTVEMRAV